MASLKCLHSILRSARPRPLFLCYYAFTRAISNYLLAGCCEIIYTLDTLARSRKGTVCDNDSFCIYSLPKYFSASANTSPIANGFSRKSSAPASVAIRGMY